MLFVSLVLVAVGIGLGVLVYRRAGAQDRNRPAETDPLEYAQPGLFRFLENKMWLDELYDRTVIAFAAISARVSDWMDRHVWDGLVRAFGGLGQLFGIFTANFDERGINAGVDETTVGTRGLGRVMSRWHRDKSKLISVSSPSACSCCCSSTHGWLDHSANHYSARRRVCAACGAEKMRAQLLSCLTRLRRWMR